MRRGVRNDVKKNLYLNTHIIARCIAVIIIANREKEREKREERERE